MTSKLPMPAVISALSEGRCFKILKSRATHEQLKQQPVVKNGMRKNGTRKLHELPPLFFCLNPHPAHNGSAFFSVGNTRISAAVSGPLPRVTAARLTQSQSQKDSVSVSAVSRVDATVSLSIQFAPFASRSDGSGLEEFLSDHLQAAPQEMDHQAMEEQTLYSLAESVIETLRSTLRLGQYPNSLIDVHVLVLSHDGGDLFSAIVNAVSLAMLQARIAMTDIVTSCVAYALQLPGSEEVHCCLQLDGEELEAARAQGAQISQMTFALLPQRGTIAHLEMVGCHLHHPTNQLLIDLLESACSAISLEFANCARATVAAGC